MQKLAMCLVALVLCVGVISIVVAQPAAAPAGGVYHSPFDVAFAPSGAMLAVSDRTANVAAIIDPVGGKILKQVALNAQPTGVAWLADSSRLLVSEYGANTVAEIDPVAGTVLRHIPAGHGPMGVAVASKKKIALVCNSKVNNVSVINLADGKEVASIAVVREPYFVAISEDETRAVVGNLLPLCNAVDPNLSSAISIIDLTTNKKIADVRLPGGSTSVRKVVISADGAYAYAVHTLGRTTLPTTQLERGWVNTNALSIIDLKKNTLYATVLLDRLSEGAADPWGLAVTKDGKSLFVSLAGVHQMAKVELAGLHDYLAGKLPDEKDPIRKRVPSIWFEVKADPNKRSMLANDLAALYAPGLITRVSLGAGVTGPRGLSLSSDGKKLAVGAYFTGQVLMIDAETCKVSSIISMGPQKEADSVRKGELVFHDATRCFQHWLSCATCHPNNGRTDGMNWDLLNDGIGNPKNSRSLLNAHQRGPMMAQGIRESMDMATLAGFKFIQFHEPTQDELESTRAYIRSLTPEKSPYVMPNGDLTPLATKGKAIFNDPKVGCASCHSGAMFTDLKKYNVGTKMSLDTVDEFITPTLLELWRTAPYLHSGEAITLQEMLTTYNKQQKHGSTAQLSPEDLNALVVYLLSL